MVLPIIRAAGVFSALALLILACNLGWTTWWLIDGCYLQTTWFGSSSFHLIHDTTVNGVPTEPWKLILPLAVTTFFISAASAYLAYVSLANVGRSRKKTEARNDQPFD